MDANRDDTTRDWKHWSKIGAFVLALTLWLVGLVVTGGMVLGYWELDPSSCFCIEPPPHGPGGIILVALPAMGAIALGIGSILAMGLAHFAFDERFSGSLTTTATGAAVVAILALLWTQIGAPESHVPRIVRCITIAGGATVHTIGMALLARDVLLGNH